VGFHLTAHPLDTYAQALKRLGVTQSAHVEARANAGVGKVKIAGTVVAIKERITRTGSRMAWVRVSDAAGSIEVTCFSEVLNRARDLLGSGSNVLVDAELKKDGDSMRITALNVAPLDKAAAAVGASIRVWLHATAAVPHIRDMLAREHGGRGRVTLVPRIDAEQDVEIALPGGYNVTPRLAQTLKSLPGVDQVEEV
ncbi:MAG: OB-fold nucleic acid binding domain-containing protein, partial [Rhodopila sp.]